MLHTTSPNILTNRIAHIYLNVYFKYHFTIVVTPGSTFNGYGMNRIFFGNVKETCYPMLFILDPNMFIGVNSTGSTRKNILDIIYVIALRILVHRQSLKWMFSLIFHNIRITFSKIREGTLQSSIFILSYGFVYSYTSSFLLRIIVTC